jgi:hypothetical protein
VGCYRQIVRAGAALLLAGPLVAADLLVKAEATTPWWAYHERSFAWVVLCLFIVPGLMLVTRIPAPLVPPAVGVLLAGVLGNVAAWNGMEVPNPILVRSDAGLLAFNLADMYTIVGIVLLVAGVGGWLIRNRALFSSASLAAKRSGSRTLT